MPNWKKVLVSGSNAELNQVTASYFKGDGSAITNLPSPPIDTYNTSGDNRIITSVNSSTVQGEDKLTFDGDGLTITGHVTASGNISGSVTSTGSFGTLVIDGTVVDDIVTPSGTQTLTNKTLSGVILTGNTTVTQGDVIRFFDANGSNGYTEIQGSNISSTQTLTLPAATGTFTVNSATQTLTNKTITGATLSGNTTVAQGDIIRFFDANGSNGYIEIQGSNISSTQTLTLPNATGTFTVNSATQTLTNKTITGATLSGNTTVAQGDIIRFFDANGSNGYIEIQGSNISSTQTLTLPNATGTFTVNSATQTLTNKTLSGATLSGNTTVAQGDIIRFFDANGSNGYIEIQGSNISSTQTLTLPNATGTFTVNSATQTLTNKTLSGATLSGNTTVAQGDVIRFFDTNGSNGYINIQGSNISSSQTLTLPGVTGTISVVSATETLQNKTISSPTLTGNITIGSGDTIRFLDTDGTNGYINIEATNINSSKTITLPNASGEFTVSTATQTLTNKTLTTPVIDSISTSLNSLTLNANVTSSGNVSGSVTSTGSFGKVQATTLHGDGSALTNLPAPAVVTYNTAGDNRIITSADATSIQGESSLQFDGSTLAVTGDITVSGTVDGRDVAADGTKLDTIETNADVTDTTNVEAAGALMDSELTDLAGVKGVTISTLVTKTGAETLTNKTLTSPILNTGISGTAILDEDDMSTDSETQLATQQSIKAYVDAQVTAQDLDFQGDTGGALNIDLDSETMVLAGGNGLSSTGSSNTVTFNIDTNTVTTLAGSQTLTNKTLTNPVLNGTLSGTAFLDEDDFTSNSAIAAASQQSIKAYVDAQVTAQDLDLISDSGTIDIDLDSESLTIAGGTGINSSATSTTLTVAIDNTVTTLAGSQTLTNKTLTAPVITSIVPAGGQTLTLPTSTDTIVGRATTDTLTNKTLTAPVISTIVNNSNTLTLPTTVDTLVGRATTDTLTNKTLTTPVIDSISTSLNSLTLNGNVTSSGNVSGSVISTGSFGRVFSAGDSKIGGNLDVTGTLTAKEFHTTVTSASIVYADGSNKFGNSYDDVHNFTGSLIITGSISGSTTVSASFGNIIASDNIEALGTGSFRVLNVVNTVESQGTITAPGFIGTGNNSFGDASADLTTVTGIAHFIGNITGSGNISSSLASTGSFGSVVVQSTGSFGRVSTSTLDLDSIKGNWTNAGNTIADLGSITTVDIDGGTIDGTNVTVGSGKTLDVSAGTLTTSAAQNATIVNNVGTNVDIGSYSLTAQTLVSDVSVGTAPLTITSTTKVNNLNVDRLDDQDGSYYLDFTNMTVTAGEVTNTMLANDSVSFGGVSVALGSNDDTPAFNLSDATAYTGDSSLVTVGTIGTGTWQGTDVGLAHGGTGASNAGTARSNLGLAIGTDVQAYDAQLADVAGLAVTDGGFIVGNGSNFVLETGADARTSLGVDPAGTDNSTNVTIAGGSKDYITLSGQALTINQIDLTDDVTGALPLSNTALVAGTNITLDTNTLNVDDAFLVNDANDSTSGTITAAGFITTATGSFTHISTTSKITGSVSSTGSFGRMEIAGNFVPKVHNVSNLGSTTNRWANIYSADLQLSNMDNDIGNEIDGTKGSWTIQEGSDDLYLLNRRNGKKYRFKLEEIT